MRDQLNQRRLRIWRKNHLKLREGGFTSKEIEAVEARYGLDDGSHEIRSFKKAGARMTPPVSEFRAKDLVERAEWKMAARLEEEARPAKALLPRIDRGKLSIPTKDVSIRELGLPMTLTDRLIQSGIKTIGNLTRTDAETLMAIPFVGLAKVDTIRAALKSSEFGELYLKGERPSA